jgi:cyclophilin family peptidyl-prolyl cis-trans isomerase/HEAT repeat protein
MRNPLLPTLLLALLWSCGGGEAPPEQAAAASNGPWSAPGLRAVLDAQDHRRTDLLCTLLKDSSATVRAAAAMAVASVQDTAARSCLLAALGDADGTVRGNAAFALGWVADSVSLARLNKVSDTEKDTAVLRVMLESGFRAELRLNKHDATWYISFLQSGNRDIRTRAMQSLARLPKEDLAPVANDILQAVNAEQDPTVRMFLVGALNSNASKAVTDTLKTLALTDSLAVIRIAAVRALGAKEDPALVPFLLDRVADSDPGVQQTAVEQLQRIKAPLDGDAIWKTAQEHPDYSIKLPLYGLVMKHGNAQTRMVCGSLMQSLSHQDLGPYWNAALVKAYMWDRDTARYIMVGDQPAVVRQAAFETWLDHFNETLRTKEIPTTLRDESHMAFMREALLSGDAGLAAAALERLQEEEPAYLSKCIDAGTVQRVRSILHPVRDLETLQYLDMAIAKRDGLPLPAHKAPPFNHPIDLARLSLLKEGQQYRITTTKGEIVLALEPTSAPGSSVAFDSLVTAGYYNGKAFHRVVPNFVAQGGCPRGDGYGGMPWTLRTEIGPQGFVEGAVGLASAGHDTESCQFFIMTAAAPHLDGRYTRFAHVVSGMDVAKKLQVGDVMQRVERVN